MFYSVNAETRCLMLAEFGLAAFDSHQADHAEQYERTTSAYDMLCGLCRPVRLTKSVVLAYGPRSPLIAVVRLLFNDARVRRVD